MNRFLVATLLAGVTTFAMASGAAATTVVGAKTVTITSADPNTNDAYIQISELRALDFGNTDVALSSHGATTTVSSNYPGSSPSYAIDGVYPEDFSHIFHSNGSSSGEFFTLTLASPTTLAALEIYGRAGCCTDRDLYHYSIFNVAGDLLTSGQLNAYNGAHFDSVAFERPVEGPAVPEPATWALMIGGFGLAGTALRRRRAAFAA